MSNLSQTPSERAVALLLAAARAGALKKAVFSKPQKGSDLVRAVAVSTVVRGEPHLQLESFHTDNKAKHQNLSLAAQDADTERSLADFFAQFSHVNLLTVHGDCELLRAKSGKTTLLRADAIQAALAAAKDTPSAPTPMPTQRQKAHILHGDEAFLKALDVSDANGRVYDKKQAKFRQINRFLELLRDVEGHLPPEGTLHVLDLCCGKSYLSFAVYHYLHVIKGRTIVMEGVDLKADVVAHCNGVAQALAYDGLRFYCEDVTTFTPAAAEVDLVVSLHACDIATDLVLNQAIRHGAKVILSTPCCHHELNHTLDCPELSMIARHSMLRQKLCDAATDAMRLLLLEAYGYRTESLELIDPEETPKNVMLRAVRKQGGKVRVTNSEALHQYREAARFFVRTEGEAQQRLLARADIFTEEQ